MRHTPPYLVNPIALDARTDITTKMLADSGYAVQLPPDEDGQEAEITFKKRDYERKFFSDETNLSFVRCFLDHAKCDPLTGEPGKTIAFAVSRRHATKLVTLLNEEATRRWPEAYGAGSAFAVQVTSDIPGAQQMTIDFANNNLNGKSRWRAAEFRDYDTSRTRVCVTVGMMTTGYDCEDVLNVVLARPIFSPTDFIQIKGRGTRLHTFRHDATGKSAPKTGFALFDFFANCEFFEKEFDYDQKLNLPNGAPEPGGVGGNTGGGTNTPTPSTFTNTSPDPIALVDEDAIGLDGMKVDREMYRQRFAEQVVEAVDTNEDLKQAVAAENWAEAETLFQQLLFEKPKEFWNLDKLRKVYQSDRQPTFREILQFIFGLSPKIATREQLTEDHFQQFLTTQSPDATKVRELRHLFHAFVLDGGLRHLIEEGDFARLRALDASLIQVIKTLGQEQVQSTLAYVKARVQLDSFSQVA